MPLMDLAVEIEYWEAILKSKLAEIQIVRKLPDSVIKRKQVIKEASKLKTAACKYSFLLKRANFCEPPPNRGHFRKKIVESSNNSSVILDEAKEESIESPRERILRIKAEREKQDDKI